MTVYIVFWELEYSSQLFVRVYQTREGAEKFLAHKKKVNAYGWAGYYIQEEEVLED